MTMTREDIENKTKPIFSAVMYIDPEEIDDSRPLWMQQGIDELDILELLEAIDEEFGTNLWGNDEIDLLKVSLEDLYNIIEQAINK